MERAKTVLLACLLVVPCMVVAQIGKGNAGNTAVYSQSTTVQGSDAFVDASAFSGTDLCNLLYTILSGKQYYGPGLVIDARGITTSSMLDCKSGTPWIQNDSSPTHDPPNNSISTILLPAGTITIYTSWVLPSYTRIIGEGNQTVISAGLGFTPPGWDTNSGGTGMIEMGAFPTTVAWGNFPAPGPYPCLHNGPPCLCPVANNGPGCGGIGVQDLTLDASQLAGTSVNGIYNASSQEMTYVDHVAMNNIVGIGLRINTVNSGGSGPYSNITFNAGSNAKPGTAANGGTACVDIQAQIRGLHGITCTAAGLGGSPAAAIYVDGGVTVTSDNGGGNTIKDVHVDGFQDGILIGSQFTAPGYILTNINGSNANHAKDLKSVVHICGTPAVAPCPATQNAVYNESLMGITSVAGINTVQDDLTQTTLADSSVAMYIVGMPFTNGTTTVGYSRFTTSPRLPSWGVGTGTAAGACPATAIGGLFSKTNGSPGSTLYVCAPTSSAASSMGSSAWRAIK
jgi:hypothetical protein